MANRPFSMGSVVLVSLLLLALLPLPAAAFGAGNIPSIAQIEGLNFRHGGEIPTELDSLSLTQVAGYAQNYCLYQGSQVDYDDGEKSLLWQLA
jgi:hypothetical protein